MKVRRIIILDLLKIDEARILKIKDAAEDDVCRCIPIVMLRLQYDSGGRIQLFMCFILLFFILVCIVPIIKEKDHVYLFIQSTPVKIKEDERNERRRRIKI